METQNLELDNLVSSENFAGSNEENPSDLNRELTSFFKNTSIGQSKNNDDSKNSKAMQIVKKEQDFFNLLESSSIELSSFNLNNEIISGIKELEFETELEQCHFPSRNIHIRNLRKKYHAQTFAVCAHAVYFVGIANQIRRNIEEIRTGSTRQKNSMLLNEMKKTPGLHVGIIGCGKLGYQLARCLLEYSEVYPNELQISTRQPELLKEFHRKNIKCYYDNRRLINSVNIAFICVLPSQLEQVVKDIKDYLPEKCIIYCLVRPYSGIQLKNFFNNGIVESFILKPEFNFTDNFKQSVINWNFTLDIFESFNKTDLVNAVNPFSSDENTIISMSNKIRASYIYALINICSFLNLAKKETLSALKNFAFFAISKNFKIEEAYFYENKNVSLFLPIADLVETATKPTEFSKKLDNHKSLRKSLAKNFSTFYEEANSWRMRNNLKS
ncbi:unnamed protein product [Brachionus calyciflorus]|uniref:Pyrroline-5-carboxylate reductase catalytic N-terminal domain-containing protein n=1 Tax=Brachionus calyciflorus TaxID=104777 RepID=A0A813NLU3_9BILA|nr:unnamed protein product [Brachionus calyciflorus]